MNNSGASKTAIKYAAALNNVREVTLYGEADLSFWKEALRKQGFFPYQEGDKAILMLSAIDAKWRGFKFREFVIAVGVCYNQNGTSLDGYYLSHAFNSSKLFAFSERMFFGTPYSQADIQLENKLPAVIKLYDSRGGLLHAEMAVPDAPPIVEELEWKGPIFLPNMRGKFFAILAGETAIYPFSPEADRFEIKPRSRYEIFRQLIDSGFTGSVWSLRSSSRHAKSKTYK